MSETPKKKRSPAQIAHSKKLAELSRERAKTPRKRNYKTTELQRSASRRLGQQSKEKQQKITAAKVKTQKTLVNKRKYRTKNEILSQKQITQKYVDNEMAIEKAYWKMVDEGKTPMAREIVKITGIHENTIRAHLKKWDLQAMLEEHRPATRRIVSSLAQKCIDGKADAATLKLWMALVHKWQESQTQQVIGVNAPTNIKIEIVDNKKKPVDSNIVEQEIDF